MIMWPEVQTDELQPPMYKSEPGRPRKVRIKEYGEYGTRRIRPGVAYKCTKCDKFGNNAMSCKSPTQDPNALKIKRKPKAGQVGVEPKKNNIDATNVHDDVQADAGNIQVDVGIDAGPYEINTDHVDIETDTVDVDVDINIVHVDASQVKSCVVDTSQVKSIKVEGS
ncbi:hypothetical protein KIW84_044214 [Lathyrus oleraceus]|uniref:Uncharacterized protein n=1 Tax=Pisum sativum TaxID=3888 RepID=A0A9D4XK32_PEA|nr:hypothetical protein KIW84_044214 [Pisum sativum]